MAIKIIFFLFTLFVTSSSYASIIIDSEEIKFNKKNNQIEARGDVKGSYEKKEVEADFLYYDKSKAEFEAEGDIYLRETGSFKILADDIWSKDDFSKYEANHFYAMLDGLNHIQGQNISYDSTEGYRLRRAKFTACNICDEQGVKRPLWSFSARKVFFDTKSQNVYYQNAFFNILDVPVMYFPFFSHPSPFVKKRSGFLPPSIESSSNLGNKISTPFFINIAENIDMTYTPTMLKRQNLHHHIEARALTKNSKFNLELGYIRENEELQDNLEWHGLAVEGKDNWVVDSRYELNGLYGFQVESNIKRTSSRAYLQRYLYDFSSYENSDLLFYKYDTDSTLFAEIDYGNDLRGSNLSYYRLPHITYKKQDDIVGLNSNFIFDTDYLIINNTEKRQRLSITESLSKKYQFGDFGNVLADLVIRGDAYNPLKESETDKSEYRMMSSFHLSYDNSFYRSTGFGNEVIKPQIKLSLIPKAVNEDAINNYDSVSPSLSYANLYRDNLYAGYDYIDQDSRVSYGVNYLVSNRNYQITSFFGQLYRFSNEDDYDIGSGIERKSSDFVSSIDLEIMEKFNLVYNSTLAHYDFSPYRNEVTGSFNHDKLSLSVNYTNYNLTHISDDLDDTEFFNTSIGYKISDSLKANARALFDFENEDVHKSGMQRINLGLIKKATCVDYHFTVEKVYIDNQYVDPDLNFKFNIILKGIADSLF